MPRQHELFEPTKLVLAPAAGLREPRLWVRRLAVWKEPGGEVIRDVSLRPGLNIIWSPDGVDGGAAAESQRAIGHGSGKTLFCRLLRYCLGEQRVADEEQRDRIAAAFPDGIVGAEVMVDGVCWAVVRPIGIRRRHVAVANGNLDEIAAGDGPSTSIEPLIDAIERSIVTPSVAGLIRAQPGQKAWPVALAWLTRDQECRFDDVLDWRSPVSGSDAPLPASGRETGPRREALRAFLNALTEEERSVRQDEEELRARIERAKREADHLTWDVERRRDRLVAALGLGGQPLPDMPLLVDVLWKAATERLGEAAKLPAGETAELAEARRALEDARARFQEYDEQRIRLDAQIPVEAQILSLLRSEMPGLDAAVRMAATPVCQICDVPIDKALAEGCKISLKQHDEQACRARLEQKSREIDDQSAKIERLRSRAQDLLPILAVARQKVEAAAKRVEAIEAVRDARDAAWQSATRLRDEVERLAAGEADREAARLRAQKLDDDLARLRERLGTLRAKQGIVFGTLTEKFDPIVKRLVGREAKGSVTLTGVGLDLKIDIGGDRRTAAIESLKVLAFDLACLCLSIEGATRVPAFVVHDSPREADLGLSIYGELFRLVRDLETQAAEPLFQYIVTTTTPPPEDLRRDPWLRLTLRGSPGPARLLAQDL